MSDKKRVSEPRDIFMATEEMQRLFYVPPAEEEDSETDTLAAQISQLTISGILIAPDRRWTMINDEVVYTGQTIGPYRLVEVKPNAVVLEIDSEQYTIQYEP
jgi:hypothetical protein